jgi:hypothetical protein
VRICDCFRKIYKSPLRPNFMKGQFTIREEANALTCCAFRNGFIEDLHAGKHSALLDTPGLSRITDAEMKKLMIGASAKLAELLEMKESSPDKYWELIKYFDKNYCHHWVKDAPITQRKSVSTERPVENAKTDLKPLPRPNVDFKVSDNFREWTPEQARAVICNPLCAGVGPDPALIFEDDWVRNAAQAIAAEGAEQFLVNMMAVLRAGLKKS